MHAQRAAGALCVALSVATAAACSGSGPSHDGPLHELTDGSTLGFSIQAKANTPYVMDMRDLCTDDGRSIQIKRVTPWKPTSGIRVVDWGVRANHDGSGSGEHTGIPGKVSQTDGFTTGPVTVACHSKKNDEQFFVSVAVTGSQASMYGATVYYDTDGDHYVLDTQMTLTLCTTGPLEKCNPPRSMQGD